MAKKRTKQTKMDIKMKKLCSFFAKEVDAAYKSWSDIAKKKSARKRA